MLRSRPIGAEMLSMLAFSMILHLCIVFFLVYQARLSSAFARKDERLEFMFVTPVDLKDVREYKNKLPPPVVPPPPEKPKEQPRVVEKTKAAPREEKKEVVKKEPREEREKERAERSSIKDALTDIFKDLNSRPQPKADNFNAKDYKDRLFGPGRGGSSLPPEALREIAAYAQKIKELIISNWFKPSETILRQIGNPQVYVTIKIDADGNIVSQKIEQGTGNTYYDRSIERAIERSNPVSPPPENIRNEVLVDGIILDFMPGPR